MTTHVVLRNDDGSGRSAQRADARNLAKRVAGGLSASTSMKPLCSTPKHARKTRPGSRPTGNIDPWWNARSVTSAVAPWGGRKARCRGSARILTDILTRASVINLARPATLGLHQGTNGWAMA
jgi:hypothetical protein